MKELWLLSAAFVYVFNIENTGLNENTLGNKEHRQEELWCVHYTLILGMMNYWKNLRVPLPDLNVEQDRWHMAQSMGKWCKICVEVSLWC